MVDERLVRGMDPEKSSRANHGRVSGQFDGAPLLTGTQSVLEAASELRRIAPNDARSGSQRRGWQAVEETVRHTVRG